MASVIVKGGATGFVQEIDAGRDGRGRLAL
jgi:hypothetical protein